MTEGYVKKSIAVILLCITLFFTIWYAVGEESLYFRIVQSEAPPSPMQCTDALVPGDVVIQPVVYAGKSFQTLSLQVNTFQRENSGNLGVDVFYQDVLIGRQFFPAADFPADGKLTLTFDTPVETPGGQAPIYLVLYITETTDPSVGLYYGSGQVLSRGTVSKHYTDGEKVVLNGALQDGALCLQIESRIPRALGHYYWGVAAVCLLLMMGYGCYLLRCFRQGKTAMGLRLLSATQKYRFLSKQLVRRDFKTKYKRSFLGVFWSFLNPLLTMGVQYLVFSTLFKSSVPNFGLYLLIGVVCFNFISEASSMGLMSILGNAHLITKVYVPKYIYPFTRVLSSSINLGLSLIPILLAMVISGAPFTPALLLLPYGLLCLFLLGLGMAFLLSSLMVFFRDTQFLWGIVNMLWLYLTPIFYPESIIGEQYMGLYQCNPMYPILKLMRTILMEGTVPAPETMVFCGLAAVIPLAVGLTVFKKTQDRFILYL